MDDVLSVLKSIKFKKIEFAVSGHALRAYWAYSGIVRSTKFYDTQNSVEIYVLSI